MFTIVAMFPSVAGAAHPMLSEDTGTQGSGNFELELGHSRIFDQASRSRQFQPQLSYGYTPNLDLILQPSWLMNDDPYLGHTHGFGDTNLDVKWRFFGSAPWSLGVRAGLEVATAEHGLGLPRDKVAPHAIFVATVDATPFILDMNLGYAHMPGGTDLRADLYHATGAVMYVVNEKLNLTLDLALNTNPDPAQNIPQTTTLVGAIYTLRPGLDVDIGYQAGLNALSTARQWLFGLTYRWAP